MLGLNEGVCPSCRGTGAIGAPCPGMVCRLRPAHFVPPALQARQVAGSPESQDPRLGTFIGQYLLCGVLGRGGFGSVYDALGSQNQRVALKLLAGGDGPLEAKALRRFQGEARALKNIDHPNVVRVVDVGMLHGQPYMAMELVAGGTTLRHWQREHSALGPPLGEVRGVLGQLLDGLGAAHQQSLVHRDIKPANVMLSRSTKDATAQVKILDFGLVKDIADSNSTSAVVGTAAYMAPEQFRRQGLGPWTDVYAVGVLAAELISGVRPFSGASPAEMVATKLTAGHDPLQLWRDNGAPDALLRFIGRALALTPSARFQSAGDMRLALDAALDSLHGDPDEPPRPDLAPSSERTPTRQLLARFAKTTATHRSDPDDYEREQHLGGAMARVSLARDRSSGLRVVIKELRDDASDDARELFQREASALALIQSPFVVGYLEHSNDRLVVEYVDGPDLAEVLAICRRTGRPLAPAAAAQVIHSLTRGLADLHAVEVDGRGSLVHRDIKPANILVSRYGDVKVADLGIVQVDDEDSQRGRGTLVYMAPEQLAGKTVDRRTDVYAAGLVVYEVLTNATTLPPGMVGHAELSEARSNLPRAPSVMRAGLAAGLDEVLLSALSPDPSDRPADIASWGAAVVEAMGVSPDKSALAMAIAASGPSPLATQTASFVQHADDAALDRAMPPTVEATLSGVANLPAVLLARPQGTADIIGAVPPGSNRESGRPIVGNDVPKGETEPPRNARNSQRRWLWMVAVVVSGAIGVWLWPRAAPLEPRETLAAPEKQQPLHVRTASDAVPSSPKHDVADDDILVSDVADAETAETTLWRDTEVVDTSDRPETLKAVLAQRSDAATSNRNRHRDLPTNSKRPKASSKSPSHSKPTGLRARVSGKVRVKSATGGQFAPWVSKPLLPGESTQVTLGASGISVKLTLSVSKAGRLRARARSTLSGAVIACGGLPKALPLSVAVGRTCRVTRTSAGGAMSFTLSKVAL